MDTDLAVTSTVAVDSADTRSTKVAVRPGRLPKRSATDSVPADCNPVDMAPTAPRQRGRPVITAETLAAARALKAAQAAQVERMVAQRMTQLSQEAYQVPWLHVEVAGSLPAASALCAIERCSGAADRATGSPWVALPLQNWLRDTGLDSDQWLQAREALRELGIIHERRCFDPAIDEIGTEIAFDAGRFELEVAMLHAALRQVAWDALKRSTSA